jgi:hypothetical protein
MGAIDWAALHADARNARRGPDGDATKYAYEQARSARFEHGENTRVRLWDRDLPWVGCWAGMLGCGCRFDDKYQICA